MSQSEMEQTIQDLQRRVGELENKRVNLSEVFIDVRRSIDQARGIFQVVSSAPSTVPVDLFDQIQVYVNGATLRLYWYDWSAATWHYVTASA